MKVLIFNFISNVGMKQQQNPVKLSYLTTAGPLVIPNLF
jgi:hypothetical protein